MKQETITIGITYGYVRVSTAEQNEARQLDALKAAGVDASRIFIDHQSGKDFNRPAWQQLTRQLTRGDLLVITSIDRMGRNYNDILNEWRTIVKERGIHIRVIDMPLIDTTSMHGLLAVFISDLVLQILSFVAEMEREYIRKRQQEGIAAARARGVRFGRPPRPTPECFESYRKRYQIGEYTLAEAAHKCSMSPTTFWRKTHSVARQSKCNYRQSECNSC